MYLTKDKNQASKYSDILNHVCLVDFFLNHSIEIIVC